jgi:hypothetical protein
VLKIELGITRSAIRDCEGAAIDVQSADFQLCHGGVDAETPDVACDD